MTAWSEQPVIDVVNSIVRANQETRFCWKHAQVNWYELKCPKRGGNDVYLYNHKTCGVLWMKYPIEGFTVDDPELLHIAGQAMRDWEKERDKGKYADRHVYLGVSR